MTSSCATHDDHGYFEFLEAMRGYFMLQRGLAEYSLEAVDQALRVLDADGALYRSEKTLGVAQWLAELHAARKGVSGKARDNVTWLAVATAPPGYCHARSTIINTLLEDITAGLPFEDIARKWAEKMAPLQYQRPQAPPSAGNIAQAEKVIAELGAAGALKRRFAKLEDVWRKVWETRHELEEEVQSTDGPVFGHLEPKDSRKIQELDLPPTTMTWTRFAVEVLPGADVIEYAVGPSTKAFIALVTAVDPDAPPILQWDTEDQRNPVNWYVYPGGFHARRWGLEHDWTKVNAICPLPPRWHGDRHTHHGDGVILILDGCRDTKPGGGLALFPEVLKSEYRSIRATLEAHSRSQKIEGAEEATACGIDLRSSFNSTHTVRVRSGGSWRGYVLDRWM
jgi:hypothetical protein